MAGRWRGRMFMFVFSGSQADILRVKGIASLSCRAGVGAGSEFRRGAGWVSQAFATCVLVCTELPPGTPAVARWRVHARPNAQTLVGVLNALPCGCMCIVRGVARSVGAAKLCEYDKVHGRR